MRIFSLTFFRKYVDCFLSTGMLFVW